MFSWPFFMALVAGGGGLVANMLGASDEDKDDKDEDISTVRSVAAPDPSEARTGFYAEFFDISDNKDIQSLEEVDFGAAPIHEDVFGRVGFKGEEPVWDGGQGNFFAARFLGGVVVEQAGTYTFRLESDSNAQLKLGGDVVIENDTPTGTMAQTVTLDLDAGLVPLELLYFETRGDQTLKLKWSGPDTDGRMVALRDVVVPLGDKPSDEWMVLAPDDIEALPSGFSASYFDISDNKEITSLTEVDFDAAPAYEGVVSEVNYSGYDAWWDGGRGNFFAARVTGGVVVEQGGLYTFNLTSDSISQLKIGDEILIENNTQLGTSEGTVTVQLDAGMVPLEILYLETRGAQVLNLEWSGPDTGGEMVLLENAVLLDGVDLEPVPQPEPEPAPAPEPEPEPEPAPAPEPEPAPVPDSGDDTAGGVQDPILPRPPAENSGEGPTRIEAQEFSSGETIAVAGGRTTTLRLETTKEISSIEVTDKPAFGNVTVNPDNSFALVLSGTVDTGALSFGYKVTYADGSTRSQTAEFDVQTPTQGAGWGMGEHYMLETDADGDVIVETGDNHRKVYVSESDDALSRSDIAALEGLAVEDITARWLLEHPDYGGSEGMALTSDVGMDLWYELTIGKTAEPGSHWLLFEAGHEYSNLGKIVGESASGESELHPLHITSWGDGPAPVINDSFSISQSPSEFVVISNLNVLGGINIKISSNILISDTEMTVEGMGIRDSSLITLHDSSISHVVNEQTEGDQWTALSQGLIAKNASGLLLEGNVFHHNAWEDDYHEDGSLEGGMAPNMYSHNVYLQWDTSDVTYRDNISSQSSSIGAQLRGGAYAEDNLFLDNNVAVNFLGGNYKDYGHVGNFTYFADNVITSGAYKEAPRIGGQGWGATNGGYDTTMLDNIVAHLADPDDPSDLEGKEVTRFAVAGKTESSFYYEDTMVLNWLASDPVRWKEAAMDRNLEDVDVDQAMETTIQRYAAQLTDGQTATIQGLMDYILTLSETTYDDLVTARVIVDYFQAGFGMDVDGTSAVTHSFVPNDLAAGVRWDNKINWDSDELPSDGDQVALGGNWVQYGTLTTRLDSLDLGDGGWLTVTSGRLDVQTTLETGATGGQVSIDGSGQFWTEGYADAEGLDLAVAGGRFANTGEISGDLRMEVSDNAQAILATDNALMTLTEGSELRVEGSGVKAGFDGDSAGTAILQMDEGSRLNFVADADGFSAIEEFRSGAWDQDGSPVHSGVSFDGTLQIDLSGYEGGAGTHKLVGVDALHGMFDEISIFGLSDGYTAQAIVDFETDQLLLEISMGTAESGARVIGDPNAGTDEAQQLWDALTEGQGSFEDTPPPVIESTDQLPEMDLLD